MTDFAIRDVTADDAQELLSIYSHYVLNTAISFEYDVPTVTEFSERILHIKENFPYICAVEGGKILGYAYAGAFHPRAAYQWCAELSIYLRTDAQKRGLGRVLYEELERQLKALGILNLYACVATTTHEDEYLTNNSVQFHSHLGFKICGEFHKCGKKFDRWYDMVWMEKIIGNH